MEIPKGYKQTDLGVLPLEWEVKKLGQLCKVNGRIGFRGYTRKDLVQQGDGAYAIGGKHITHNRLDLSDADYISWAKYFESPEIMVQYGDIVFAQRGTLGRSAIIDKHIGEATINPSLVLINNIKCNNCYLILFLQSRLVDDWINAVSAQTSIPMLSQKQIESIDVILPPIDEQRLIVSAISEIDELIAGLGEQIEKKCQIKEGAMQQLLTGKTRLPGFTQLWREVKLGDLLSYEQPTQYLVSSTDYVEQGTPVLTAGKTFILGYTTEDWGIYNNLPVIIFDDFVTESKYVDFPFKAKSSAMKMLNLRDKSNNLRFIYEKMQQIDFPMTDHKRYWIAEYSKILVSIPNPDEQNAIAQILSDMDDEIRQLEAEREKYTLIKQGMMQELLTGKTRLV